VPGPGSGWGASAVGPCWASVNGGIGSSLVGLGIGCLAVGGPASATGCSPVAGAACFGRADSPVGGGGAFSTGASPVGGVWPPGVASGAGGGAAAALSTSLAAAAPPA